MLASAGWARLDPEIRAVVIPRLQERPGALIIQEWDLAGARADLGCVADVQGVDVGVRGLNDLLDRFGGSSAIGLKRSPGPLYGVSKDVWSALAVAVTYADSLAAIARALAEQR